MTGGEALPALIATLDQIRQVFPPDRSAWERSLLVRLAVERLWITAGNLSEVYRIEQGIGTGVEPWSELADYRNFLAHPPPGDIASDRVYFDTSSDLDRVMGLVRAAYASPWEHIRR